MTKTIAQAIELKLQQAEDHIRFMAKELHDGNIEVALENYLTHSTFGDGTVANLRHRLGA